MPKKIPIRQCVGCRTGKPKKELIRIVKSPEGTISIDTTGRMPGRGAYLCANPDCLAKAKKSHALSRALDTEIPDEIYRDLANQLKGFSS